MDAGRGSPLADGTKIYPTRKPIPPKRSPRSAVPGTPALSWVNSRPQLVVSPPAEPYSHADRASRGQGPDRLLWGRGRQISWPWTNPSYNAIWLGWA